MIVTGWGQLTRAIQHARYSVDAPVGLMFLDEVTSVFDDDVWLISCAWHAA